MRRVLDRAYAPDSRARFRPVMFETFSALAAVGLSTQFTASLSTRAAQRTAARPGKSSRMRKATSW